MTVALSSLRVEAGFDASPYTRGMQEKVAADKSGNRQRRKACLGIHGCWVSAQIGVVSAIERSATGYARGSRAIQEISKSLDAQYAATGTLNLQREMIAGNNDVAKSARVAGDGFRRHWNGNCRDGEPS